jgi:hypothetical protein
VDRRGPLAATERRVKTAPPALLVLLAAMVLPVLKASQVSQVSKVLLGLLERLLPPSFLQCPLARASSAAWSALRSMANQLLPPRCPSPGTVSSDHLLCQAPLERFASTLFPPKLSLSRRNLLVKQP